MCMDMRRHMVIARNDESGQAIVEMTVALIAIMVVFLGIIFAFAIGHSNIDTLLECRGMADSYAGNGSFTDGGVPILTWEEGGDGRMYTNDDTPVIGTNDDPDIFRGELQSDEVDLVNGFNRSYVEHNFAADIAGVSALFLVMANMTSYSQTVDPVEEMDLDGLESAFRELIYDSDLTVTNSVFMPSFSSGDSETEEETPAPEGL